MSVSRRDFLKVSGLALTTAWSDLHGVEKISSVFSTKNSRPSVPILQTWTNEHSAQFKIFKDLQQNFAYQVEGPTGEIWKLEPTERYIHPAWLDQAVDHLMVRDLKLGSEYRLKVLDSGSGDLLDERTFTSLERSKSTGRCAIISCMCDDFPAVQEEMWKVVADQNPDVVFLVGDASYLDGRQSDDEKGMWRRHLEARKALDLYRWPRLRPVISIWDDHDFGINDGDRDFPFKDATRQMFEAMFGSVGEVGLVRGPSLSLEAHLFGQRFYLMDSRYYRTRGLSNGSHWGGEQEDWLFSRLETSSVPAFLMNGSQFFGGYSGYESFEKEHPEQLLRVQRRLAQQEAPVVFVSGDRHFSEAMKIESKVLGYETLELTSSSLHSYRPATVPSALNPRRMLATPEFNFILIESSAQAAQLNLKLQSLGLGGRVLFSHETVIHRTS